MAIMKYLFISSIIALGCASTRAEAKDPPEIEKNPWPDHFRVNITAVFRDDYGENYSCHWDLDFKREGRFFTISGADNYSELKPATTPQEHRENIKRLACLLPSFRVQAETLNLIERLPMNCMAELQEEIVKYYRLSLSEDEAWEATESDLNYVYELAHANLTTFWTRWAPSRLLRGFREGEDGTVRGVTLTTKERTTIAGQDCLIVNSLAVDKFRGRRFHTTVDNCYNRSLNLNLLVSVHPLHNFFPPFTYQVEEVEVLE